MFKCVQLINSMNSKTVHQLGKYIYPMLSVDSHFWLVNNREI